MPAEITPQQGTGSGYVATRRVTIPLGGDRWVYLEAWFPMTEEEWARMIHIMLAMKSALVLEKGVSNGDSED